MNRKQREKTVIFSTRNLILIPPVMSLCLLVSVLDVTVDARYE
jgi:hypothetical protein